MIFLQILKNVINCSHSYISCVSRTHLRRQRRARRVTYQWQLMCRLHQTLCHNHHRHRTPTTVTCTEAVRRSVNCGKWTMTTWTITTWTTRTNMTMCTERRKHIKRTLRPRSATILTGGAARLPPTSSVQTTLRWTQVRTKSQTRCCWTMAVGHYRTMSSDWVTALSHFTMVWTMRCLWKKPKCLV